MVAWTKDTIAARSSSEIQSIRDNAVRHCRQDIVALCDEELAARKPSRPKKAAVRISDNHRGQYVSEFHFVCPKEDGITRNQDGTIWTGTWVVREEHATNALKYGAIVALHTSRAEPSYLQGPIRTWRKGPRERSYSGEQLTQTEEGILFLFEPSDSPLQWKGEATGEKGYGWAHVAE
jgi:hypothetical protein